MSSGGARRTAYDLTVGGFVAGGSVTDWSLKHENARPPRTGPVDLGVIPLTYCRSVVAMLHRSCEWRS